MAQLDQQRRRSDPIALTVKPEFLHPVAKVPVPSTPASKMRKHTKYAGFIVRHSNIMFGVTFSLNVLAMVIVLVLHLMGEDALEMDTGIEWSYRLRGSNITDRDDGWNAMVQDKPNTMWAQALPNQAERATNFDGQELEIYYKGSCFTQANLASMQAFENELINHSHADICNLERYTDGANTHIATATVGVNATMPHASTAAGSSCRKPTSVLRLFDGTYEKALDLDGKQILDGGSLRLPTFRPDPTFGRIKSILQTAFRNDGATNGGTDLKILLQYAVGSAYYRYQDIDLSTHCRTKLHSGAPLRGYHNIQDRLDEQRQKMGDLHVSTLKDYLESHDSVGSLDVVYISRGLEKDAHTEARKFAFLLMIGPPVVCWLCLVILFRSLFLPTMLAGSSAGTFFWTVLIYRYAFGFKWFGLPMQLSPFAICYFSIVQFVLLFSEWQDIDVNTHAQRRLGTAMRQANLSVGITIVAGMVSFFGQCFSRLAVVQSTGLFFGIACFVNLFTYLVYYPPLLCEWQAKIRNREKFLHRDHVYSHNLAEGFYRMVLGHKIWRWFALAAIIIILSTLTIFCVQQSGLQKRQPIAWRETTNYGEVVKLSREEYEHSSSGHQTTVRIAWGLDHLEQKGCHYSDSACLGDPIYDNLFDLSSTTAQKKLVDFCNDLQNLDKETVSKMAIQRRSTGPLLGKATSNLRPLEMKCFILTQEQYYKNQPNSTWRTDSGEAKAASITMPFTPDKMESLMKGNTPFYPPHVYRSCDYFPPYKNCPRNGLLSVDNALTKEMEQRRQKTSGGPECDTANSYYRHYEVGAVNWLASSGNAAAPTTDLEAFVGSIGGSADITMKKSAANGTVSYAGDYGNFIRYASIEVNLTLSSIDADYGKAKAAFDTWDAYVADKVSAMPLPLRKAFQSTPKDRSWAWMEIKDVIILETIQGSAISVTFFFIVLAIYMNNWGVALSAAVLAASIPTMVVGFFTVCGWKVGLLEAISLVLPVGISVDMMGHMAYWYCSNDGNVSDNREERAERAFVKVAPAILTGAALLFVSSLFLLFSPLEFFFMIGITLACTAVLGLMIGFFLIILLGIAGPEGSDMKIIPTSSKFGKSKVKPDDFNVEAPSPLATTADTKVGFTAGGLPQPPGTLPPPQPHGATPTPVPATADSDSDSDSDTAAVVPPAETSQSQSPLPKLLPPIGGLPPINKPTPQGAGSDSDSESEPDWPKKTGSPLPPLTNANVSQLPPLTKPAPPVDGGDSDSTDGADGADAETEASGTMGDYITVEGGVPAASM